MNLTEVDTQIAELNAAGFEKAAEELQGKRDLVRKLAIAYEFYPVVTQDTINKFQAKLREATKRAPVGNEAWAYDKYIGRRQVTEIADQLVFTDSDKYAGAPPADVVAKVKEAKTRGVFDAFTVAAVAPVATQSVPYDPIVFGRISGCSDYFFIGEWGTDVKFSDIVAAGDARHSA